MQTAKMNPAIETVLALTEVELPARWWLDGSLNGGVAKRIGWWEKFPGGRLHKYIVVFNNKTRGPVTQGTNPIEEDEE